jgi:uncharacterized membrane protein YraQ (UPF0718 family)
MFDPERYPGGMGTYSIQLRTKPTARFVLGAVLAVAGWCALYVVNEVAWDFLIYDLFDTTAEQPLPSALHFFFYDLVKLVLLVAGITYVVTFLQSFISVEKTQAWLSGKREGVGHVLAAILGVVTPFCSCSSVPLFIAFVRAGIPLGITMTFLVASPLVSEIAFVLLLVYFGWEIALAYLGVGLSIAVLVGWLIQRLKLESWLEPFVTKSLAVTAAGSRTGAGVTSFRLRGSLAWAEATSVLRSVFPYLLAGLAIGAFLHGWVPDEVIRSIAGAENILAVPLMVLVGIPLYGGAASILPLVHTLAASGVPVGTLLALMMSVIALSLPEMVLLKKVMKVKLLVVFVSIVGVSIVLVGYLLNAVF